MECPPRFHLTPSPVITPSPERRHCCRRRHALSMRRRFADGACCVTGRQRRYHDGYRHRLMILLYPLELAFFQESDGCRCCFAISTNRLHFPRRSFARCRAASSRPAERCTRDAAYAGRNAKRAAMPASLLSPKIANLRLAYSGKASILIFAAMYHRRQRMPSF